MAKVKKKYKDPPRFKIIEQYENEFDDKFKKHISILNTILTLKLNQFISTNNNETRSS